MAIDINEPVEQGSDLILNSHDGSQSLGTTKDFEAAAPGELVGLHTNPEVDAVVEAAVEVEDEVAEESPVEESESSDE